MTPRSLARLAYLRHLFTGGRWRERHTAAELATLDGAYDHLTADDFEAAHPWVELAERYGEVYVYPLAEPVAGASVQIEVVRTGEDLILRTGRTGRWSALRLGEGDGDHDEAEGTGAAPLVEWLASVGCVPREPVAPAGLDPSPW